MITARNNTSKEKTPEILIPLSELIVGDIVKFEGTRDKLGIRKILTKGLVNYFSQVMRWWGGKFHEESYTSNNGVNKLTHVFRDGHWMKVDKNKK